MTFTQAELTALKALAKANGTYYQGSQSFSSLPNGIVLVDTVSGNPIGNPPNAADLASVTVTGANASGWLIVMGSVTIHGSVTYTGLVYAADDLILRGTGSGNGIIGAAINLNVQTDEHARSSAGDTETAGNAKITHDCTPSKPAWPREAAARPPSPKGSSSSLAPGGWCLSRRERREPH